MNRLTAEGLGRGLSAADAQLSGKILVPFCPQSELSGVNHKDFLYGVWYRRTFELTKEQLSGRAVLHFGAVDYRCEAFVNGVSVGAHTGGYVSFCFDVTEAVHEGENVITVYAEDDERDPLIPRGQQSELFYSHGCDYTRTTGIWQTVWLEFLPETHIEKIKIFPSVETGSFDVEALLKGAGTMTVEASYEGRPMGAASVKAAGGLVRLHLSLQETHLWELGCGRLYDLKLTYPEWILQALCGSVAFVWILHLLPAQWKVRVPAHRAGSGLLSGRHLHRPQRSGVGKRHSSFHGLRL